MPKRKNLSLDAGTNVSTGTENTPKIDPRLDQLDEFLACCEEGKNGCLFLTQKIVRNKKVRRTCKSSTFNGEPAHRAHYRLVHKTEPPKRLIRRNDCPEKCVELQHYRAATDDLARKVWESAQKYTTQDRISKIQSICLEHDLNDMFVAGIIDGRTYNHVTGLENPFPATPEQFEKVERFLEANKIEIEMSPDEKDRFLKKYPDETDLGAHWGIQNMIKTEDGYGLCDWNGDGICERPYRLSGAVYEKQIRGNKADYKTPVLRHLCKTHYCWYPKHLEWGSAAENSKDTMIDGNSGAVLTQQGLANIERLLAEDQMTLDDIGLKFGVSRTTIAKIRDNKTMAYLPENRQYLHAGDEMIIE